MIRLLILLVASLGALAQTHSPLLMDYSVFSSAGSTLAVNTAERWAVYGFVPDATATVNKFSFFVSSVAGTLGASDIRVELLRSILTTPTAVVTFTDVGDLVNLTGHPFSNGDTVRFSNTGGALPAGISATTTYFVCNKNANDFQLDDAADCLSLVTDYSGATGTNMVRWLLQASTTVTTTPTGAAWVESTGFTTSMTAGTSYYFSVTDANGTPGTNNFTTRWVNNSYFAMPRLGVTSQNPTVIYTTTNNGSTFSSNTSPSGFRLEFSGSVFAGAPLSNATGAGTSDRANGTQEVGSRITVPGPAGATYSIKWAAVCFDKQGTPAADARLRLYSGANGAESLLATSQSVSRFNVGASTDCTVAFFNATLPTTTGGAVIRVMLGSTSSGDTNANTFRPLEVTIQDDANSKTLMRSIQHAKFDGTSTWAYTDTKFVPIALGLSSSSPFTVPAGGGGGGFAFIQ